MRPNTLLSIAGLLAPLATGCLAGPSTEEALASIAADNGASLNGPVLNGSALNGEHFNGTNVNGIRRNGTALNGANGVDGALYVTLENGQSAELEAGDILTIALDHWIATLEVDSAKQYWIGTRSSGDGTWVPVTHYGLTVVGEGPYCPNGAEAVVIAGRWDPATGAKDSSNPYEFTFACGGYALAKCVEMGYVPQRQVGQSDLGYGDQRGRLHEACVRALRADYCGDGIAHTRDGIRVDVYDWLQIQTPETNDVESIWSHSGALCLGTPRLLRREDVECSQSLPLCSEYDDWRPLTIGLP